MSPRRNRPDGSELARLRALLAEAEEDQVKGDVTDDVADEGQGDEYSDSEWESSVWTPDDEWEEGEDEDRGRRALQRGRGEWHDFGPSKPIKVEGGLAAKTRRGVIGSTWWSKRFLAAIESVMVGGRLGRGRTYARQGQVIDLAVRSGVIEAHVQGSRSNPYRVRLAMPVVPDADWAAIVAALGAQAGYAARMLAGDLPPEIEEVFAAEGASLFPAPHARLTTDCTCPDWANPCKHIAAVCYLVAEEFDRDPFAVLAWRGRDRGTVLGELRRTRSGAAQAPDAAPEPVRATTDPSPPPLQDCLVGFWKAGPELGDLRVRPDPAELPAAVLRHLARGIIEVRGRDVGELLAPAYAQMTAAAARRAVEGGS